MLPVPPNPLDLSDGKQITLPAERGKVVVLAFYAAWCPVSRKMLNAIADVSTSSRQKRGLVILAVDEEDGDLEAKQFARANGITGPVALDHDGDFTRAMKVDTVPALVAIGRDGVVRRVHAGYHGEDDLATLGREVDALLAAPRPGDPARAVDVADAPAAGTDAPPSTASAPKQAPAP
jgi:peroxiredoxin